MLKTYNSNIEIANLSILYELLNIKFSFYKFFIKFFYIKNLKRKINKFTKIIKKINIIFLNDKDIISLYENLKPQKKLLEQIITKNQIDYELKNEMTEYENLLDNLILELEITIDTIKYNDDASETLLNEKNKANILASLQQAENNEIIEFNMINYKN